MRRIASLALLIIMFAPAQAWGHAEEPNSQTVFAVPDGWVLRANVGIVRSAQPDRLICEEAFLGGDGWILGTLGPELWLTFGDSGVMRTTDGCSFDRVVEVPRRPTDATVHPTSGGAAFIINGAAGANGLYVSVDEGMTFELVQTFADATQQTTGVRYIDGETIFVSGYDRENSGLGLAWTVDVASGATTEVALPAGVTYPYVLAASQDRVLLLGRRGDQTIFWGPPDDLEQNELIADTWPSWAELSDDGRTAYVSGTLSGRGVVRGSLDASDVATWESLAEETTASCVQPVGDELFVCGIGRTDGYDVLSVDAAGEVSGVLDFRDFAGVRSDCPTGSDVATVCPAVWAQLAPYFGAEVPSGGDADPDTGVPATDASATGDEPQNDQPRESGCTVASGGEPISALLMAMIWAGNRRRRRR